MKTGLSKRERFLIFIAASAVLIFASLKYGISPLYEYYSGKSEEYGLLSAEKMMTELTLQGEALTRENHEEAKIKFQEIERRYPSVTPNEEVDRILTGLCIQNGLSPVALKISDPVNFTAENQDPEQPAAFSTVNATMLLTGDYRSLKNLISAVEKIDYIRIGRVSFVYGKEEVKTEASNISVLFEVMMRNAGPEAE